MASGISTYLLRLRASLRPLFCILFLVILSQKASATTFVYSGAGSTQYLGKYAEILEDKTNERSVGDIVSSAGFKELNTEVPNLGVTTSTFWIKINVANSSNESGLLMELAAPTIEKVVLYRWSKGRIDTLGVQGTEQLFTSRRYNNQNFFFDLGIAPGDTATYFLKVKSSDQVMLPLSIGNPKTLFELSDKRDMLFGIFFGLMVVMLLYNLFVYFTVRDSSYLYYVVYILFVCLLQTTLQGYSFRFLWPGDLWLAKNSVFILPSLAGLAAMVFAKVFLQTATTVPILNRILTVLIGVFCVAIALVFAGKYQPAFGLMQLNTIVGSLFVLFVSIVCYRKGNRTAMFFFIGWSVLLVGAVIFVLKDFAVLPYNNITASILEVGTAAEVVLLSFALADKINVFRKEKEESQAQAMEALQENERIVREQNVILEGKVTERTYELKLANDDLSHAMKELKEAETQLVESEKMASLGQLTAGIAHEINNPINFVTSNVKPLNRDVKMLLETVAAMEELALDGGISIDERKKRIASYKTDIDYDYLKEEIDQLLSGIGEGASRTAEIVKGLRVFSRLDEDDLKKADMNEGLDSTLTITNNLLGAHIKIEKHYSNLPLIECYPGKLNQVFLNIISNGVYAIKKQFGDTDGGLLTISTSHDEDNVLIKIADNGTGMDENTKKKLFEPFFTTKDVGEGTGLGMSIAYNTITKHFGQIQVNTELGKGTEFILILPINHTNQ
jgi:signal transduction histidine kinase